MLRRQKKMNNIRQKRIGGVKSRRTSIEICLDIPYYKVKGLQYITVLDYSLAFYT